MNATAVLAHVKGWTCQRVQGGAKCGAFNPSRFQVCRQCGKRKPRRRVPAHRAILSEMPYEEWVELYGETCNICGAEPGTRRLHRDHDHATGKPRGILCFRCNAALRGYMTAPWLRAAATYLERVGSPSGGDA